MDVNFCLMRIGRCSGQEPSLRAGAQVFDVNDDRVWTAEEVAVYLASQHDAAAPNVLPFFFSVPYAVRSVFMVVKRNVFFS